MVFSNFLDIIYFVLLKKNVLVRIIGLDFINTIPTFIYIITSLCINKTSPIR
jgi:ABC-type proline/glycine betaine transport system permease subunit